MYFLKIDTSTLMNVGTLFVQRIVPLLHHDYKLLVKSMHKSFEIKGHRLKGISPFRDCHFEISEYSEPVKSIYFE